MNKPSPKTLLGSKGDDWRAAGFTSLKIPQEKRQGKNEKNNLHRISKAAAIALQGEVTLQSEALTRDFQSHKINNVTDILNSHSLFSLC